MHVEFWRHKPLEVMSSDEWESLCDHCGLCCLVSVEDEDSGEVFRTSVVCRHYDCEQFNCSSYTQRTGLQHGCVQLTPELVRRFDWLPDSCAYRVVMRGDELPATHPLCDGGAGQKIRDDVPGLRKLSRQTMLVSDGPDVVHEHYLLVTDALIATDAMEGEQ